MPDSEGKGRSGAANDVGTRLVTLRAQHAEAVSRPGLTASAFAALLGLDPVVYEACEAGAAEPGLAMLAVLHRRTGVSLDWLIAGS